MIKHLAKKAANQDSSLDHKGDEIMKQIGVLEERSGELENVADEINADPEEVGKWITVIGKALLAIFKS